MNCNDCENFKSKIDTAEKAYLYCNPNDKCFDCYNYKPKSAFHTGDLVMRKDGKPMIYDIYIAKVILCGNTGGNTMVKLQGIEKNSSIRFAEFVEILTLAPPKPAPDQIKGYELTGKFRPSEGKEAFWAHNCGENGMLIRETDCGRHSAPCWILRKIEKKHTSEFNGTFFHTNIMPGHFLLNVESELLPELKVEKPVKITVEWDD